MLKIAKWFVYFIYFLQFLHISTAPNVSDIAVDTGDPVFLIVGGYHPKKHTLTKHVVSLRSTKPRKFFGDNHYCAGSILNSDTIVTAAHCIVNPKIPLVKNDPSKIIVVAGITHRLKKSDTTRVLRVKKVIKHHKYRFVRLKYDIAVLKLEDPIIENGESIQKVPLVSETPKAGTKCIAAGWGRQYEGGPLPDEILYVSATIADFDQCKRMYSDYIKVKDGMLCTHDLGSGTCKGDSGGPLFCDGKLAGIVSWGIGCGHDDYPSVFTDVHYYADWIAKNCVKSLCVGKTLLLVIVMYEYFLL